MVSHLSAAKCIILAANLASQADIISLRALTFSRADVLTTRLSLRILLSFLPESLEPSIYTSFLLEAAETQHVNLDDGPSELALDSVADLSDEAAETGLQRLRLLRLRKHGLAADVPDDALTEFLVHRAHRIDSQIAMFPLVPRLIEPFLSHSDWVKDWYAGAILPLARLEYEYYPGLEPEHSLADFENITSSTAMSTLLSRARLSIREDRSHMKVLGRDFRGIVAPWVHGSQRWKSAGTTSKRQRLEDASGVASSSLGDQRQDIQAIDDFNSWKYTNEWIVSTSMEDFAAAVSTITGWGGPLDADLGANASLRAYYVPDPSNAEQLKIEYCRACFAAVYAAEEDTPESLDGAHSILVRLAELLGFDPPPDLATSIHLLPKVEQHSSTLQDATMSFIQRERLLHGDNPLTEPKLETFSLLQMFVYSAYLLGSLGHRLSIVKVAKLRFWSDDAEQFRLVQRLLHDTIHSSRHDAKHWSHVRDTMLWLWDWAITQESAMPEYGHGLFGKVRADALELEIIRAFCLAGQYHLVAQTYLSDASTSRISREEVETVIVGLAYQHYDAASNGNKTRGGVKRAVDLITAFQPQFSTSAAFRRCNALISATHALSFYSLILHRGMPFKPVSIRVQEDPITLISLVLEQNSKSYTQLDNLIDIARNLVKAAVPNDGADLHRRGQEEEDADAMTAERRVLSMSIESALRADDFETAYSYVVNRLSPSSLPASPNTLDDVSWRAAYLAGRQRSKTAVRTSATMDTSQVRRLEQRMDLLSRALLLAPPASLPEILAAWRRCEEELLTVMSHESAQDAAVDQHDAAQVPGGFGESDVHSVQPRRKEIGRGAAEEAPMGLFEAMRGASAALQRTAGAQVGRLDARQELHRDDYADQAGRPQQRKRDMVASAVTGGLAQGIGWMLGATPVRQAQRD